MADSLTICTTISDSISTHWAATNLAANLALICPERSITIQNITTASACLGVGIGVAKLNKFTYPNDLTSLTESYATGSGQLPNSYILTGDPNNDNLDQRGTIYATIDFVESLGLRFLDSESTVATSECPHFFPKWQHQFSPKLEYRKILGYDIDQNSDFAQNLHNNGRGALTGGGTIYATPPGFVHTSYKLLNATAGNVPPPEIYAKHPEWFWPDNKTYGQLCWSNQSLIDTVTKSVLASLHAQPDATVISVSQNDNYNYCNSTAEREIYNDENGSLIGPILRAVNAIADAVKIEFPHRNVAVDTLAYQWTRAAPFKTKPRDNVIIRLCSIECK